MKLFNAISIKKCILAYICLLSLLTLTLSGCGKQDVSGSIGSEGPRSSEGNEGSSTENGTESTKDIDDTPVAVAHINDVQLPEAVINMKCFAVDQNWLYIGTYNSDPNLAEGRGEIVVYRTGLFSPFDPEPHIVIPYDVTPKPFKPYHLLAFVPDGEGGAFIYGQHDPLENGDLFTLDKYDERGDLLWSRDYTGEELAAEGLNLTSGAAASDGRLYLYAAGEGGTVVSFDSDGAIKASHASGLDTLEGVLVTEDDGVYEYGYVGEKQSFAALGRGEASPAPFPMEFLKVFGGRGNHMCLNDAEGLWEYDPETDSCSLLWRWDDEYVQMTGRDIEHLRYADDVYYVMNRMPDGETDYTRPSWRPGQTVTFAAVSFQDRAAYPGRETITLARTNSMSRYAYSSFGSSRGLSTWTEDLVRMYNRQSKKYYIEIVNEEENLKPSEKLNRVEMQILKGGGPDLLEVSDVFAPYMAEKGMLEDLTGYYGESGAVSLEDLLPQIREGGAVGGMNVLVIPAFYILTCVSKEPVPLEEWTPWKFIERCQESQMFYSSSPYEMFGRCVSRNLLGRFVDYESGECHFDSPDFIRLLEECKKIPTREVPQTFLEEADFVATDGMRIDSMSTYVMNKADYGKNCYQGMPDWEGGGHLMSAYDVFAMNSQSKCKEGAWDFLEFLLSKETQDKIEWGFPARTESFDRYVERSYRTCEDNIDERFIFVPISWLAPYQPEEEDFVLLREMVASSMYVQGRARNVVNIIVFEEVSMFFKGDADLEQTIEKIQNRVSLYLKEGT